MNAEMSETLALEVGGVPIIVRAQSMRHLGCVTTRLGRSSTTTEPEFELRIGSGDPTIGRSWPDDEEQWVENCGITEHDGLIRMRFDDVASAVVGPTEIRLVGPVRSDDDERRMDDLIQFSVAMAMAGPDRMLLHAAAVGRGGDAVIVVGLSGRGKSTLAAAALAGGWDLLGDDMAVVRPSARRVQAVQRPPLVSRELVEAHHLGGEDVGDHRDRLQLPLDVIRPDRHRLVGVIIVDHDTGPGRIELVDGPHPEVLDAALAVPPARSVIQRHLAATAALLNVPLAKMYHASDPTVRVRRCQELLDEAFTACRQLIA